MRRILLAAVLLAGCGEARPYTVRLVKPDGKPHRTYVVHCYVRPAVTVGESGCQTINVFSGISERVAPTGWMWEVEGAAEEISP